LVPTLFQLLREIREGIIMLKIKIAFIKRHGKMKEQQGLEPPHPWFFEQASPNLLLFKENLC